jgi:NTP pyrophosphatase (non-canonical NTP hydrolase)
MTDKKSIAENTGEESADVLLQQLFHLKGYEVPDAARMTRNKQNIMRQVREINSKKRWSLSDLLEMNIPWFFAEPRYGIAALFVVFAALQFWGASTAKQESGGAGLYAQGHGMTVAGQNSGVYTNSVSYPKIPDNLGLFAERKGDGSIKPAGSFGPKK